MRIGGSLCVFLCGIAVVVGVFLPWLDISGVTVSGWDAIEVSIPDVPEPFMALVGGAVMAVCALPAFIVSLATRRGQAAVLTLGILATLAALVAIGGTVWFIVPLVEMSMLGSGFWISIGMAGLGLIFAIIMLVGNVVEHARVGRAEGYTSPVLKKIEELAELKEAGVISKEEFEAKKSELLSQM